MKSEVISFTVGQVDVIYVANQVNLDLRSLSRAYPKILSINYVMDLYIAYSNFLADYAVNRIGFSIHDPENSNLVYHELRYDVLYGGEVVAINPYGGRRGKGGILIKTIWVPKTAKFTPWVVWSSNMLSLPEHKQRQIVSGTGWATPGEGHSFNCTYEGGNWSSIGSYASGSIGARGDVYSR